MVVVDVVVVVGGGGEGPERERIERLRYSAASSLHLFALRTREV